MLLRSNVERGHKKGRTVPDMQQPTDVPLSIEPQTSWLRLDDGSIGVHFWAWFMNLVLSRWGVDLVEEFSRNPWEQVLADHNALFRDLPSAALNLDQDDVEGVLLEKAAKLCVRCEVKRAGGLIRDFIKKRDDHSRAKSEVDAGKARQLKKSQLPRSTPLIELIASIFSRKPDISASQLLDRLKAAEGNGTIEYVDDDVIAWRDKNEELKKNKRSGLKDMLYKEKQRQSKASSTRLSK